uniref:ATP synthase complex subunit 8 n=1 Tax=Nematocarcinus gracilis TaxID=1155038 RepID=A0A5P8DQV9_9EUCA|nr:ATP synthase F0 subunit 8 [Nematocarcinus gracilis]
MPQMAPLLWLNLFIFFCFVFILFLISNYFIKIPTKTEFHAPLTKTSNLNWKW